METKNLKNEGPAIHAEFTAAPSHVVAQFPKVTWWERPGLRKLYFMMPILFLGMELLSELLDFNS